MKKQHRKLKPGRFDAMAFAPVVRGANRLEVKAGNDAHELILIGAIGKSWWDDSGITEQEVRDALKSVPSGKKINARINSEGGSVKEGLGIYNAFKERRADITAHITGYALSIASIFPLGAGKVVSPKSAIWMMHKAWSWNQGNADDMRQAADMLDAHDETLVEIYAVETGKSKTEIRTAMEKETWVKGSDAVDWGLADESDEEGDAEASYRPLDATFISRCKNISPEILNALSAAANERPTPTHAKAITATAAIHSAPQGGAKPTTKENQVNKEQKVALLKTWGVEVKDSQTDADIDALIEAGKPQAKKIEAKPEPTSAEAKLEKLQKQIDASEARRIRAEVVSRSENKIPNDQLETWVEKAIADEKGILALIDGLPVNEPGGAPIGFNRIEGGSEPENVIGIRGAAVTPGLEGIYKEHKTTEARYGALKKNWNALHADAVRRDERRGMTPQASNTYSATLVTSFLMSGSVTDLQHRWAMLKAFSMDFSTDSYKPLATGVLKHVTVGSAVQTDATNFESGNNTVAPISVAMHQYTQAFSVSNIDLNSGLRMQDLVTINTANFANKIIEVATVPITTAIFTGDTVTSAAAAFSFSDLATLQALLKKSPIKNLILDGAYIARIANTPAFFQLTGVVGGNTGAWKAFGWDLIAQNTDWTGAGANVQGFACHPQAIAGITGLPLTPPNIPGGILSQTTMTVPELEVPVALFTWFNPATRTMWTSFDIMAGFHEVDTSAGFIVKSA